MADIKVYCPNCNTEYEVPEEYLGQEAECSQCSNSFVVALPEYDQEIPADESGLLTTDTTNLEAFNEEENSSEQEQPEAEENTTSTIKLSRSSIGMVPEVQDSFKLDVVNKVSETPSGTHKEIDDSAKSAFKSKFDSVAEQPSAEAQPPQQKMTQSSIFQKTFGLFKKK